MTRDEAIVELIKFREHIVRHPKGHKARRFFEALQQALRDMEDYGDILAASAAYTVTQQKDTEND